ncbi:nucleotidyltransferase [Candidatus Parcubacteria bacterium]|nr:nucleotidyltransferase [Candidatus Parcubacteria bacterium]MBI4385622.1 nucleotidyltransferase [Candidatus Parcubacteria bacterium]
MEQIDPRRLLANIARILSRLRARYLVTGGMAVFVWGRPRFTADIDIVVALGADDVEKLVLALRDLSAAGYVDGDAARQAIEEQGEFNFIDGESGVKVDFWVAARDRFSQSQFRRRVLKRVHGQRVAFISPEDLILSKLMWHKQSGTSRHREDIESVVKIQKHLDWRYINRWARVHATTRILRDIRRGSRS